MNAAFYIASAVTIIATLMVVTRRNAVHALLYLVVSLLSVGLMLFTLGAPFAAALQVIIYAGAIMILFVFVIMMINPGRETPGLGDELSKPGTWVGPVALVLVMGVELIFVLSQTQGVTTGKEITPKEVSVALLGPYLLGVELASVLLMAGLVGAFHLGRREPRTLDERED